MTTLSSRAMLVQLSVRQWTARKLDKKVTDETNRRNNAAEDAGRYNKALLSKEALAEIGKIEGAARTEHYKRTLPWKDDGTRILSSAGYLDYTAAMREYDRQFQSAVGAFLDSYESFKEDARVRLNGMFNPDDYPDASVIGSKFKFGVDVSPLPDAADFRVEIGEAQADAIRRQIEERAREALTLATRDVWSRIADAAGRMVERLRAYNPEKGEKGRVQGIFRDSLVDNIKELVELMPTLNVANDPKLAEITERLANELTSYSASELREDDNARKVTADKAEKILAEVSDFLA
jgi:hypothetical protein